MAAFTSIAIGVLAATAVGTAVVSAQAAKDAKQEAAKEQKRQEVLAAEAQRETDRTAEIAGAQEKRTDVKTRARRVRSAGGGGLLTGGDTGLMKTKLGE